MLLYRLEKAVLIEYNGSYYHQRIDNWDQYINDDDLYAKLREITDEEDGEDLDFAEAHFLPPIVGQEVWAAGVNYPIMRAAFAEEASGQSRPDYYAEAYNADIPLLYFKASAQHVVAPGGRLSTPNIAAGNLPEPHLTALVTSSGSIVGYTVGSNMRRGSIDQLNPLYLSQSRVFAGGASLGPGIYITEKAMPRDTEVAMDIYRDDIGVYRDTSPVQQWRRSPEELVAALYQDREFPHGCFLMVGAAIAPLTDFTLEPGDEVRISIDYIGSLINTVK